MCPYDRRVLPEPVIEGAFRTHPEVLAEGRQTSSSLPDPEDVVRTLARAPEPLEGLQLGVVADELLSEADEQAFRDAMDEYR